MLKGVTVYPWPVSLRRKATKAVIEMAIEVADRSVLSAAQQQDETMLTWVQAIANQLYQLQTALLQAQTVEELGAIEIQALEALHGLSHRPLGVR